MAVIDVVCKSCGSTSVYQYGNLPLENNDIVVKIAVIVFRCINYRYKAHESSVTDKIVGMAMNGSGVRGTGSALAISPTTVTTHLKNSTRHE